MPDIIIEKYKGTTFEKDWIIKKHALNIFNALSPEQQENISVDEIGRQEKERDALANRSSSICVGKIDGQVCSFIWYEIMKSGFTGENIGYVLDVYVEDKYRKRGYGKEMIKAMVEDLRSRGIKRIDLNVGKDNDAQHFYESIGFKETMKRMSMKI